SSQNCRNDSSENSFVYRRVCYFANWAAKRHDNISRLTPEDIDPFLCTHINFAFAKVLESLALAPYEEDDAHGWTGGPGMYERVIKLKEKNPNLRILLSEYPGAKDQGAEAHTKRGYTKLVKKLSRTFEKEASLTGKEKLLLTCATAAARHRIEAGYEVKEICEYFDFISVMTYDYHGSWDGKTGHNSPLYGMKKEPKKFREWNVNNSMYVWMDKGCPREKLNIGLSAYGRAFSLYGEKPTKRKIGVKASAAEAGQYTREAGVLAYYEICEILQKDSSARIFWHKQMSVPYISKSSLWIGFDNIRSITVKMKYLKREGFGGVIIWSLDLDDKTGEICHEGPFPIFNAAKRELSKITDNDDETNDECSENKTLTSSDHSNNSSIKNNHHPYSISKKIFDHLDIFI
ncbi:unnamed protein product, partial [Didymodactylos carnosus]